MVDRLTIEEFFDAMHSQGVYPLLDTDRVRKAVQAMVRVYCADYPIKDRWPVLDLESAYEGHVNAQPDLIDFHRNGYNGVIHLRGFDETYRLDEWFDDFRIVWRLIDTHEVRTKMASKLPPGTKWKSPVLYAAHDQATKFSLPGLLRRVFR